MTATLTLGQFGTSVGHHVAADRGRAVTAVPLMFFAGAANRLR